MSQKLLKQWLQEMIDKSKEEPKEKKCTYRHKYLNWMLYHRAYQMYIRNNYMFKDYFLDWNRGKIEGRDIVEDKIFHYRDLYYIRKMNNDKTIQS